MRTKSWPQRPLQSSVVSLGEDLQGARAQFHHGQDILQDIGRHGVWLRSEPEMQVAGREPTLGAGTLHRPKGLQGVELRQLAELVARVLSVQLRLRRGT